MLYKRYNVLLSIPYPRLQQILFEAICHIKVKTACIYSHFLGEVWGGNAFKNLACNFQ